MKQKNSDKTVSQIALFFIQIFATFAFSVLYSTLALFMTKHLKLHATAAAVVTANFVALNYAFRLFGGSISGKLFSHRSLLFFGIILQIAGCYILSFVSLFDLYWGLPLVIAGSAINVVSINCSLNQLFEPDDLTREKAFLWNYSGMNIGYFLGFTISGIFEIGGTYRHLFLLCALFNVVTMVILLTSWKKLYDRSTVFIKTKISKRLFYRFIGFLLVLGVVFAIRFLIMNSNFSSILIIIIGVAMFCVICFFAIKQKVKNASRKMWAFLILAIANIVFWTLYMMTPSGIMLFLEHNVDRHLLNFLIPPQWVQNIITIMIIMGGPILASVFHKLRQKGYHISVPIQFSSALIFIGLGFMSLVAGIYFADSRGFINIKWVILCYVLQSLGELFISPIGYSMIGQLIPKKLQSMMLGTWMMLTGFSAVIAGYFSKMIFQGAISLNPLATNPAFNHTFFMMSVASLITGVIMFLLVRLLNKLIREEGEKEEPMETTTLPH